MVQQDIIEQRYHSDAVSFGGWSLDLHPADGGFSEVDGCTQWHAKGKFITKVLEAFYCQPQVSTKYRLVLCCVLKLLI